VSVPIFTSEEDMAGALVSALAFSLALENIGASEGLAIAQIGCMVMGSPKATGH